MQHPMFRRILVASAILALGASGMAGLATHTSGSAHALPAAAVPDDTQGPPAAGAPLPDFSSIVEREGRAVVNISVSGTAKTAAPGLPQLDPDDPFYEFFRRFRVPVPQDEVPRQGQGSGFIVSPDGVILTNAHVVAQADEVTVKLTDKREFKAKVIGIDKPTDIAVLKIDARDLPAVRLGDPRQTRVGEWVLAIGSPFGFENSVTAGIVSAKSRSLPDEGYVPFLQTDVAINPGNSGGPLFNLNGEVIGINSQIYSRSGGYQGLSFAIPIDIAMRVEGQIMAHGKVTRGRFGVAIQEVTQSLADSFGLARPTGALVSAVEKGSPAERAGLKEGDVILRLNGQEVVRSSDLPARVAELAPGSAAKLEIWRRGASREILLTVGELTETAARAPTSKSPRGGRLGLAARPLSPEERKQAEVAGGLLVEDAGGAAARAGIRPGDIILSLNGEPLGSADQLGALLDRAGKHVALLVQRGEHRIFVPVELG